MRIPPAVAALLALVGFAANSLLCRAAIGTGAIDAGSFTVIRIASGAAALGLLARGFRPVPGRSSPIPPFALAIYAAFFALAYLRLGAGTGALLLFGAVQLTMIGAGLIAGERPPAMEWTGIALAVAGLVVLVAPGVHAPPLGAALSMILAGAAWGVYSLRGRGATDPLRENATNFLFATPLVLALWFGVPARHATGGGIALAVVSGAIASGLGYALWYRALPSLTATRAATLQLAVPVLAALGGVTLLGESVSVRLVGSAVLVLGGIGLAVRARR